jgi:hypothetical protein
MGFLVYIAQLIGFVIVWRAALFVLQLVLPAVKLSMWTRLVINVIAILLFIAVIDVVPSHSWVIGLSAILVAILSATMLPPKKSR